LSVPYVLTAAAETVPDAKVVVAGREVTCAELERLTRVDAEKLLAAGYRRGQALHEPLAGFEGLVRGLAAFASACGSALARPNSPLPPVGCPTSRL